MKNKIVTKNVRLLIWVAFITLVWGCSNDSKLVLDSVKSPESIEISTETVIIPLDSLGLVIYRSEPVIYQENDKYYLYAYNHPVHSYDVFDLSDKKFIKRIKLGEQGPDHVNKVYTAYVKNMDSLYIMGAGRLYQVNGHGRMIKNYNVIFGSGEGFNGGYFYAPNEASIHIDKAGKNMYGYFVHNDIKALPRTPEALSKGILGKLNLIDNSMTMLPLNYSAFIRKHRGDFSNQISPNLSFLGNKVYYGFPVESNIYAYNLTNGQTEIIGAKSAYSTNYSLPYTQNPSYNFRNEGTWFNKLNTYPGKPFFYRTHWGSQNKLTANGKPTDALTKPGYVMFFDSKMRIVKEIRLDKDCYLEGSFATDEGVYFWAKGGKNENEMKLCRYSIN